MSSLESMGYVPAASELAGRYVRWMIWFALGVALFWAAGIESLYEHPTPFYALFQPNFGNAFSALMLVAMLSVSYGIIRAVLVATPGRNRLTSPWVFGAVAGGLGAAFAGFGEGFFYEVALGWATLRFHLLAMLVFVSGFGLLFTLLQQRRWPDRDLGNRGARWLLVGLFVFAVLFSSSMAMTRGGLDGIAQAYERQSYEYISDVGKGLSIRGLFRDYIEMHPYLSMHAKVHPPGPIAVLWVLSYVAGREPLGLSIATIVFGSLSVIPLFYWARDIGGERLAVSASLVFSLMPTIVLFTATSADILFMPFTITTLLFFWRAIHRNSWRYALAAGVFYAFCSLLSFSLMGLGSFFAFAGLWRLTTAGHRVAVFNTAAVMLVAFLAVHAAVRLWSGFDIVECFLMCKAQFDMDQAELDQITPRYGALAFRLLNLLCWLYFAGIPATILFLSHLFHPLRETRPLMIVLAITLIALDLLYLARGEGERSAMYIMPFIAIGAAMPIASWLDRTRHLAPLGTTLAVLAFQCWLTETVLYTYW